MTTGEADWSVYLLRCGDGSIYAGIAKDVDRRFRDHSMSKGSRYVRSHGGPSEIAWRQAGLSQAEALRLERRLKALPRSRKDALIGAGAPLAA